MKLHSAYKFNSLTIYYSTILSTNTAVILQKQNITHPFIDHIFKQVNEAEQQGLLGVGDVENEPEMMIIAPVRFNRLRRYFRHRKRMLRAQYRMMRLQRRLYRRHYRHGYGYGVYPY
ncbi:unnamed protein product [Heterobilharzia americana]|nr:unnamed protein product [Heterobilharzia americana]